MKRSILVVVIILSVANVVSATTVQGIDIDFITIGNAGNNPDIIGLGWGAVDYSYRIGKYEITNAQWNAFVSASGVPTGSDSRAYGESSYHTGNLVPVNNTSWYEALQFCNYLTSGDKSQGAYQWNGDNANPGDFLGIDRNSAITIFGTIYVIPSIDEWYKAAYYTGSGYSVYTNGQSTLSPPLYNEEPGWNYYFGDRSIGHPWDIGTGTMEQNGTFDMMGNVSELNETGNDNSSLWYKRYTNGGSYKYILVGTGIPSNSFQLIDKHDESRYIGFRVASYSCDYVLAGDMNDDCKVGLPDFAELAFGWQVPHDINDLAAIALSWLIDCNQTPGDAACVPK